MSPQAGWQGGGEATTITAGFVMRGMGCNYVVSFIFLCLLADYSCWLVILCPLGQLLLPFPTVEAQSTGAAGEAEELGLLLCPDPKGFPATQANLDDFLLFFSFFAPRQHQMEEDFATSILTGLRKHPSGGGWQR